MSTTKPWDLESLLEEADNHWVSLGDFKAYYETNKKNGNLAKFYHMHPMGIQKKCNEGLKDPNKPKNRYITSPAYDFARIKLTLRQGDPNSSYINATKVPGHQKVYEYIITQAPLANTIADFWKLLWQERIYTFIASTNFDGTKYVEYWPKDRAVYGKIEVVLKNIEPKKYFTIRTFRVKHVDSDQWRVLKQFHYTAWPDMGVPENALSVANLLRRANRHNRGTNRPMLVHCGGGCGRSGTIICTDMCINQVKCDGEVNVFKALTTLRNQRVDGVETEPQFEFIHKVILEKFLCGSSNDSSDDDCDAVNNNRSG